MKKLRSVKLGFSVVGIAAALLCMTTALTAADPKPMAYNNSSAGVKIGSVNFKLAVEESKSGKLEQANFDNIKKQMESILEEKEKSLVEISGKLNDPDYLDSLSSEAENELKHKFRMMNTDLSQIQGQYYQTLNQANMKILQKLNDVVAEASAKVAREQGLDIVLNDDSVFHVAKPLDITKDVIEAMNQQHDKEQRKN